MTYTRVLICIITLALAPRAAAAGGVADKHQLFMRALDHMMVELSAQTTRASLTVRKEYRDYLDLLVLDEYASLQDALFTGGLVPLPGDADQLNIRVRTEGPAPIAEKDLGNQSTYIAARPATIGALIAIASQVTTGPLEITSLVRHSDYQDELRTTNANARTTVPMHTMGLAVDIALVNTPLARVYEIRDVLARMQEAGDILVIGERKQLVFHVVPHPSRLGHFTDVYTRTVAALSGVPVIAATPLNDTLAPLAAPIVSTEIVSIRPTDELAAEWWAAADATSDLTVRVSAGHGGPGTDRRSLAGRLAARCVALVAGVLNSARALLSA